MRKISVAGQLPSKLPVTVVIPVKNEERNLRRCLSSVSAFREVVVVDSRSTDKTPLIAAECGAVLIQFDWSGKFPKKRNWTLLNYPFKTEWVLFLDADESVTSEFCGELRRRLDTEECIGYWLNYTNYFSGKKLVYGVPQRKLALFKVGVGLYERIDENNWTSLDMEVHEHPLLEGKLGEIKSRIDHRDFGELEKFLKRHLEYAVWEAKRAAELNRHRVELKIGLTRRQMIKYAHLGKWWYAPAVFLYTFIVRGGFLDGAAGFYYAAIKAWYFMSIRLIMKSQSRSGIE